MSMISSFIKDLHDAEEYISDNNIRRLLDESANMIEEMSAKLHNSQMERSSMYFNGGWIQCKERMPKKDGMYIVTIAHVGPYGVEMKEVSTGCVSFLEHRWQVNKYQKVVAWQPLPDPYNKEN